MSVSAELLCSFELLKPLDSNALKSHIKKGRNKRAQLLNSPVSLIDLHGMCVTLLTTKPSPRVSTPKAYSIGAGEP